MNHPSTNTSATSVSATSVSLGTAMTVTFYRTCRVPRMEDRINELPAGLGTFPTYRVRDFAGNVPKDWNVEGHFIPMWPQEALWMGFTSTVKPVALLIGAGMVNAVTGERLTSELSNTQNYIVCPPQPWLDGFKPTTGEKVFQFVAAELGSGETAEEQILGTSEFGGIQFGLFKSKIELIPASRIHEYTIGATAVASPPRIRYAMGGGMRGQSIQSFNSASMDGAGMDARSMGLGAGGSIRQKIYPDPYLNGRDVHEVWHAEASEKAYVYIVHASDFKSITGKEAPASPITYATYQSQGLPWFGLPDGTWNDVAGGKAIDALKPVSGNPSATDANALTVNPSTQDIWK